MGGGKIIKFLKKVLPLHQLTADKTGGNIGVRDGELLADALENAFSTFGGEEFYPLKEEKGARLGHEFISNQHLPMETSGSACM